METVVPDADTGEPLPPLYSRWLAELLPIPMERERNATCSSCVMCHAGVQPANTMLLAFEPSVKCCTFIPILPNFLVGMALNDPELSGGFGRASVVSRIAARVGVTPFALRPTRVQRIQHEMAGPAFFGKSGAMRCPHYDVTNSGCGIWKYRNAICATWFCKHVRGAVGQHAWQTIKSTLEMVEEELALHCALELGVSSDALDRKYESAEAARREIAHELLPAELEHAYAREWAGWLGREHDYFMACAKIVDPMTWADVTRTCGPRLRSRLRMLEAALQPLRATKLPDRLRAGKHTVLLQDRGSQLLSTYSNSDPVMASAELVQALSWFTGQQTNAETRASLEAATGITLDDDDLRQLLDFGLLQPT